MKYGLSFIICLFSSFMIFFIFSLLGNLNENYIFKTIISLSFLNSLQILTYVPAFIFLVTVILFVIFLKSNNEIIVIKSYMSIKNLSLFFIPIVLIFTFLEINKMKITTFIDSSKANLLKNQGKLISKIIVNEDSKLKSYTVLKNISSENLDNTEYRSYLIFDKKIQVAEFSNNLSKSDDTLIANNYTQYENNLIKSINVKKLIEINYQNLIKQTSIVKNISVKDNFIISLKSINIFIFFSLFFSYIFLYFLNRKFISTKESLINPTITCTFFLLYSFFIFNNSLSVYKQEYELLASLIIGILILKESLYE